MTIAPLYGISNNKEWYLCPIFKLLEMVLLCIFFTSDRAVSVKKLKKCVPDEVHFEEDGREQYDFLMEAYGEAPGSIVFYTAHQSVAVYADGEELYTLETSDSIWGDTPGWRWCFVELQDGVSRVCVQQIGRASCRERVFRAV